MKKIIFDKEAGRWEEAFPIGNGRLGAMVFGGVEEELLQMNEDSIWYGRPIDRHNPDAYQNLRRVRELILSGNPGDAERLLSYAFTATPQSQRIYQPLGDCRMHFFGSCGKAREGTYLRVLDLEKALVSVSYETEKGRVVREYISSYPSQTISVKLKAEGNERLNFDLLLTREKFYDCMIMDETDSVFLTGNLGKGGLDFAFGAKIRTEEGSVKRIGEHLIVENAKCAYVHLDGTSTFYQQDPIKGIKSVLRRTSEEAWKSLKEKHERDYLKLFGAVNLCLTPKKKESAVKTTPELLAEICRTENLDNGLVELYFHFGRYLLISSSRPGSMPANLQGIWNEKMMPPWESKYTININTEMNYWMAESLGLSECMEPLFELIQRLRINGRETARKMYGCRGFMCHHNTDLWADTAPQDKYIPATYWTQGAAFLVLFVWRHFEYNQDKTWLETWYPVLEEAVLFYLDFLIEDHGEYVTCPSVSPENTYITEDGIWARVCAGPAMDSQILRDLFEAYEKAAEILGRESESEVKEVKKVREKLPPIRIGKYGHIMEWREDYEEAEPGHRHISQLYALYPSNQITPDETPELAEAAEITLDRRLKYGGGHTGWSAAWLISLYAQLWKADKAYKMLRRLLEQSTFSNLMDYHPYEGGGVFQIDGNLGGCDAIVQMLIQDNGRRVLLLPACPKEWDEGSLEGIRLKKNATISFWWKDGEVKGKIHADSEWAETIVWRNMSRGFRIKAGEDEWFVMEERGRA